MHTKRTRSTSIALAALVTLSALAAAACGGASSTPSPTSPTSGSGALMTIFITNSVYSPNPLTVNVGQQVNFKNNDTIEHSATFDNGAYESGNIPALSAHSNPVTMNTRGTFTFRCRLHGERGAIVVQ